MSKGIHTEDKRKGGLWKEKICLFTFAQGVVHAVEKKNLFKIL